MPPRFGRYATYRDSGVEWLGRIPAHWEVRRLGAMGRITKCSGGSKAQDVAEGVPCVRYGDLYTHHDSSITETRAFVSAEHAAQYSTIRYGDLLFTASGETIDEIGKSAVNLMPDALVGGGDLILLRPEIPTEARFLGHAANAPYMAHQKSRLGRGMTVVHLYGKQLKNVTILLPPLAEQRAIADFLDRETVWIDALVAKKEEWIELLREKRTALINHALTKGLDPGAPMKDSGVDWLKRIPAHWSVRRLKSTVASCRNGVWGDEPDGKRDIACIRVADFDRGTFRVDMSHLTIRSLDPRAVSAHRIGVGDLLLEKSGGGDRQPVGVVVIVDEDTPAVCSNFIARMTVHAARHDPAFLVYLHAALYASRINVRSIKQSIGIQNLDADAYLDERIGLPALDEQRAIARFLDRETVRIDSLVSKTEKAIERLTEYRTAMISAAVTGRIDVRT